MAKSTPSKDMYTTFARCYDIVMRDVDYRGWAKYVLDICKRFQFDHSSLLNLACGTGNLEMVLKNNVPDIVSVDIAGEMVERAREKFRKSNLSIPVHESSLQTFTADRTFGVVLCLYDSLNYLTEEAELLKAFRNVRRHLGVGGGFIFDVTTEYNIIKHFAQYTFAETFEDFAYIWENDYAIVDKLAVSDFTFFIKNGKNYQRKEERHVQKLYPNARIRELLEKAGLEYLDMYSGMTFLPPARTTERVHFVARRAK